MYTWKIHIFTEALLCQTFRQVKNIWNAHLTLRNRKKKEGKLKTL